MDKVGGDLANKVKEFIPDILNHAEYDRLLYSVSQRPWKAIAILFLRRRILLEDETSRKVVDTPGGGGVDVVFEVDDCAATFRDRTI